MEIYGEIADGYRKFKEGLNRDSLLQVFSSAEIEYINAYKSLYKTVINDELELQGIEYRPKKLGFVSKATGRVANIQFSLIENGNPVYITLRDAEDRYDKEVYTLLKKIETVYIEDLKWLAYTKTDGKPEWFKNRYSNLDLLLEVFEKYLRKQQVEVLRKYIELRDTIGLPLSSPSYLGMDKLYRYYRVDYMLGVYNKCRESKEYASLLDKVKEYRDIFLTAVCLDTIVSSGGEGSPSLKDKDEDKDKDNEKIVLGSVDLLKQAHKFFKQFDYRRHFKDIYKSTKPEYEIIHWMLTGKTEEKKNILDFEDTIVYEGLTQESLDCLTELMSIFEQEDFQKGFEKDIEFWEREKEKERENQGVAVQKEGTDGVVIKNSAEIMKLISKLENITPANEFMERAKDIAKKGKTRVLTIAQIQYLKKAVEGLGNEGILAEVDYVYGNKDKLATLLSSRKYLFHSKIIETVHSTRRVSQKQSKFVHEVYEASVKELNSNSNSNNNRAKFMGVNMEQQDNDNENDNKNESEITAIEQLDNLF